MSQNILILSGKKQSGKSTTASFLCGYIMRKVGLIPRFNIDDVTGELLVPQDVQLSNGTVKMGWGVLDIENKNPNFIEYARENIWQHIKTYSYADFLKEIAIRLFGLTFEQCYGTNEQKNSLTTIKVKDILFALDAEEKKELKALKSEYLTARQFLQYFGTNICRRLFGDCWVVECMNKILLEGSKLAIVCDGRFPNEIDIPQRDYNAKSIRFTLNNYNDSHKSETALDNHTGFSAIVDNSKMTVREKSDKVLELLQSWGWI